VGNALGFFVCQFEGMRVKAFFGEVGIGSP